MILLFTGGSASGKSALAEQACVHAGGHLLYIATMQPFGEEGRARVRKHRAQRAGKGFHTVECYSWLREPLQAGAFDDATVLLECLGNLVANVTFGDGGKLAIADGAMRQPRGSNPSWTSWRVVVPIWWWWATRWEAMACAMKPTRRLIRISSEGCRALWRPAPILSWKARRAHL